MNDKRIACLHESVWLNIPLKIGCSLKATDHVLSQARFVAPGRDLSVLLSPSTMEPKASTPWLLDVSPFASPALPT